MWVGLGGYHGNVEAAGITAECLAASVPAPTAPRLTTRGWAGTRMTTPAPAVTVTVPGSASASASAPQGYLNMGTLQHALVASYSGPGMSGITASCVSSGTDTAVCSMYDPFKDPQTFTLSIT